MQRVVLDSPARLILAGFHFHSQMTPPRLFRRYMLPYFCAFADRLHAQLITKKNGHFRVREGAKQLPEVLDAILATRDAV